MLHECGLSQLPSKSMCQVDIFCQDQLQSMLYVEAAIISQIGDWRSFEVTLDGRMIHSKKETGEFPDHNEIVRIIKLASTGGLPQPTAMKTEVGSAQTCAIL